MKYVKKQRCRDCKEKLQVSNFMDNGIGYPNDVCKICLKIRGFDMNVSISP